MLLLHLLSLGHATRLLDPPLLPPTVLVLVLLLLVLNKAQCLSSGEILLFQYATSGRLHCLLCWRAEMALRP